MQPAGRLRGDDVTIFEEICNSEPPPFRIDLENLLSADEPGLAVLLRQKDRGARFIRVPGYIKLRLALAVKLAGLPPVGPRRRPSSRAPGASSQRRAR